MWKRAEGNEIELAFFRDLLYYIQWNILGKVLLKTAGDMKYMEAAA